METSSLQDDTLCPRCIAQLFYRSYVMWTKKLVTNNNWYKCMRNLIVFLACLFCLSVDRISIQFEYIIGVLAKHAFFNLRSL